MFDGRDRTGRPVTGPVAGAGPPARRLPSPVWFVLTFVVYVLLGLAVRSVVLNWIIGPLWLFLTLWVLPQALRRARGRGAAG